MITREIKRALNVSKQHPVLVTNFGWFLLRFVKSKWLVVAGVSKQSSSAGQELPNPGFCLKTLGFPADPANFSGFVGMYVHNCTYIYIYTYTVYIYGQWKSQGNRLSWQFFLYLL